jgi:dienelactone hydrolase
MPAARRLARERGLDLAGVGATGPDGVITREDVERALAAGPAAAPRPTRKVSFFSDGHRLDGLLYTPDRIAPGERRAAVVLCVGYTYLKTMVMPDIARALTAAGYVALVFDYRGFGDSEGPRWRLIPSEQVGDARAALTFLADQPQVDPARLATVGISLGGSNAIAAGALDRRVGAVVAIEAIGDGARWLRGLRRYWEWRELEAELARDRVERVRTGQSRRVDPLDIVPPDPAARAFLEGIYREFPQMRCELPLETADALLEFSPERLVDQIAPRPVLFIHGEEDRLVPADESRSLFARAAEPRRLEVLPGMDHFDWVMPGSDGFRRVADLTVGFLREALPAR